ncbi:SDR family NAD(P)-dependent oxidoreductase [Saccharothrix australiensis]|uniref:NAD(P)-dependent dehydrogenase (Short-subunit alcohol dehydrogenase family) n=1 Tax=Saccharothrix australiensis TaxID=2072 RepID=A0A495W2L0_9PSEU|nr:SDR family oxidoreductase [Saccharothrix australiensis]RKT55709.1 NAD(P)-dependent dehydrogenase (short-subunit alcohol dehydrogenase family) [Saccharothrix australiensis]
MSELSGKVALVTGGSRGIGAAIVRKLASLGADVALTYASAKDRAEDVAEGVKALGRRGLAVNADNADADAVVGAVDRTAAEFGRLDVLVNNAGIFPYGVIDEVTLEEVDRTLAVHTRAVYVASQAALRHMTSGGRIVSIGSTLAERVPYPGVALYAMSKSALIGFTRGLARDVGERGITVNLVHPGSTNTEMNPEDGPTADDERALTALGRYGSPDDIAATVAHLVGPGGANITGAMFTVDGGANA